jgi:hypothetical protein
MITFYTDGVQEAGGSNPLTQTTEKVSNLNRLLALFLCLESIV